MKYPITPVNQPIPVSPNVSVVWKPRFILNKRDDHGNLIETIKGEGNILTTLGKARLVSWLTGGGAAAFTNTTVRLGVGSSTNPADVADVSLGASEYYRVMDATFPSAIDQEIYFQATFGTGDANFAWACWGLDFDDTPAAVSGATALSLFNRKVFNFGVKDGGIWDLTVIVSFEG